MFYVDFNDFQLVGKKKKKKNGVREEGSNIIIFIIMNIFISNQQSDRFFCLGASPELLVKVDHERVVTTHPIAGTRRRGKTPAEDEILAQNLMADIKERSEHIMLVDLGRNDVNRVCKPETVVSDNKKFGHPLRSPKILSITRTINMSFQKVDSLMHIERYSHVMHLVSHVSGVLRDNQTPFDAFRSIFPAGTVSGAPKIKAMELIYQLEGQKRGAYAGAVG